MKLVNVSFAEQTTTVPAWVESALKNGSIAMKKGNKTKQAEDMEDVETFLSQGYELPAPPQNSPNAAGRVSRSRKKTSRAGAQRTSRNAQANSLRVPEWAEIGETYDCTVIEFVDVFEVVNGVQSEAPKFSQCKLETVVDGQKEAFSILFTEKLPDVGQECELKCIKDERGVTQSGKNWEVQ